MGPPTDHLWLEGFMWFSCALSCLRFGRVQRGYSEKLEKAGTVDFEKHPARKVGTRPRQCGPKVPGRFAFPSARNPRICSIWRFGKLFQQFSRTFPGTFLQNSRKDPGNSHSLLEFSEIPTKGVGKNVLKMKRKGKFKLSVPL